MFKKILFATTASPNCNNAAKVAFDLQLKWEAKLIVLHVFGVHRSNYTPFGKNSRTDNKKVPDEEYAPLVVEEMKTTYAEELEHIRNGYHTIACPMELKISQQIDMDKNGLISKIFII